MPQSQKEQHWRSVVTAWSLSSLSQPEFCKQNDLNYTTFVYWRARIKTLDAKMKKGQLVEVPFKKPERQIASTSDDNLEHVFAPGLIILLKSGVKIMISNDNEVVLAAKLLTALEQS